MRPNDVLNDRDAFLPSLRLQRRNALWAIKALQDEPLPLFTAASERERQGMAEQKEPEVALRQMTEGHNVVTDYGHVVLTLRVHPVAFLRKNSPRAALLLLGCDDRPGRALGLCRHVVLVRQKLG